MVFWHQSHRKYWLLSAAGLFLMLFSFIPMRLALADRLAPQPQAILTLGGGPEREEFTAQFAQQHPDLDIWVSTGVGAQQARTIFQAGGISVDRLHLDYRAVDTVTNFTTMVHTFHQQRIHNVYLITSDFHMKRALAVAMLVFGSQGIRVTPVSIPTHDNRHESALRVLRDGGRSLLWIATGETGETFSSWLAVKRVMFFPDIKNR